MSSGLLEVTVTGCGTRGMLPVDDMEGVDITGPAVGVVPGVGVAGLGLLLNNVCIKLSGSGRFATVVGRGPAGSRVPVTSNSGNGSSTPCIVVKLNRGNAS